MLNSYLSNSRGVIEFYTRIDHENETISFQDTVSTNIFKKLNIRLEDYVTVEQYGSGYDEFETIIYRDYCIRLLDKVNQNRQSVTLSKRDSRKCDRLVKMLEYVINNDYEDFDGMDSEYISLTEN